MVGKDYEKSVEKLLSEEALKELHENKFTGKLLIKWDKGKIKKFDLSSRISLGKEDFPLNEKFKE